MLVTLETVPDVLSIDLEELAGDHYFAQAVVIASVNLRVATRCGRQF